MFDCTCNKQYSLLLNQHNGDDAPQDYGHEILGKQLYKTIWVVYSVEVGGEVGTRSRM